MKTFLLSFLFLLIGLGIGGYYGFNFTLEGGVESVNDIVSDVIMEAYSGDSKIIIDNKSNKKLDKMFNKILEEKQQEIMLKIDQQKEKIKEQAKQQIQDYIKNQIDSIFNRF